MDKPLKIEFAPGCFDDFEGTQEELDEIIRQIHEMAENGTIMDESRPLTVEEEEELLLIMSLRQQRE